MPVSGRTFPRAFGAALGLVSFSAIVGLLLTVMVAPVLAITGMTANSSLGIFNDLPDYITIERQNQVNSFVVVNQEGVETTIAEVYDQNREEVLLENISNNLINAAIDGEDRRFYQHGGVDLPSVARAAVGQLTKTSRSGASTLTMQLVRNILILRAENDLSLNKDERLEAVSAATDPDMSRKLKEMKLAIGLEKRYSKEQILEAYLNIVLMGGSTYGVEAAAQRYFGIPAKDLSPAQSASLIAIVQNPSANGLNRSANYEENRKRRDVILKWMYDEGHLDDLSYREALATPVDETTVSSNPPLSGCSSAPVPYRFPCDYALRTILNAEVPSLGETKEEQLSTWRKGGLKVYLTIEPDLQAIGTEIAAERAPADETRMELGAAISSIQVRTGRILLMAQNKIFDDTGTGDPQTTTAVNFNGDQVHGGSLGYQPGSTYKPYVLLAFLDAGHGLNETFDASIRTMPLSRFRDSCSGPYGGSDWTFRNDAGETGFYNGIRATAGSVNSVFIQMAAEVDQCRIAELAASIGVYNGDHSELFSTPSCAIGGCNNNVPPLSQASAYATIANQGIYCKPIIIDRFVNSAGESIPGQNAQCSQSLVSPSVANTAAHAMKASMSGTAAASNPRDGTIYLAKTGTTDKAWHTWMVGSSSEVSTAVWVGNIEGHQSMRGITVAGVYGGVIRHAIFRPVAQAIDAVYGGEDFPEPDSALMTGIPVFVPDNLIGMTLDQAKDALALAKLNLEDGGQLDSDFPADTVIQTDPEPGSSVSKGSAITVYTSNGLLAMLPDVVSPGYALPIAQGLLNSSGFQNLTLYCEVFVMGHPPASLNTVVAQNPSGGAMVNKNTVIDVTVRQASC